MRRKKLLTSRNGDRKILQSIRITSTAPSSIRKWSQLSQFRLTSTKVIPIEKTMMFNNEAKVQEKLFIYSPYKVVWQIPKLIPKACPISFHVPNYISIFKLLLMSFESYVEYILNNELYMMKH